MEFLGSLDPRPLAHGDPWLIIPWPIALGSVAPGALGKNTISNPLAVAQEALELPSILP
jgi:hypothetical protein